MGEFDKVSEMKKSEFKGLQSGGKLSLRDEKCMLAIQKRLAAHEKSEKNCAYTLSQLLHHLNASLFKPQRLVSLTYEEEDRRALRSWHRFDWKLNLACFRPLEELQDWVKDPEAFRKNVRNMVIYMNAAV